MGNFIQIVETINNAVQSFVGGPIMLVLLVSTGIYFTFRTKFFQITKMKLWLSETFLAIFKNKSVTAKNDPNAISQFQALTTALAGTIGTGNIVGVATALVSGGPGAIFWMWVSAFFGMMTNYAENVLGILFRYRNEKNDWLGGPMIYIERGMHCKWLAVTFACFTVLASFGIGNMTQANGIASAINTVCGVPSWVTGLILTALVALVIIGGIKRIAAVTEKIVPFMALVYIIGGLILLVINCEQIPAAFGQIFAGAFSLKSVGGGVGGYIIMKAIRFGVYRGVFSNEAGLGSSVMVHSASSVKEPVKQGMWGVFEVFADTLIVCTLTALCILTTGVLDSGAKGAQLAMAAFSHGFGGFGGTFISIAIAFFAFSTILGWSYYGERAVEYLIGVKNIIYYKIVFICLITIGCVASLELVWSISDTFNSLMAIPNLIGVLSLSGFVIVATKDFLSRRASGSTEEKSVTAEDLLAEHPELNKHLFSKKDKTNANK